MLLLVESVMAQHVRKAQFEKPTISVEVKLSYDRIHPGMACLALVILDVQNGWHINSAQPSDENLIGTSIDIARSRVIDSVSIVYPPGIGKKFDFSDAPLEVYTETVPIPIRLFIASNAHPGRYSLPLSIRYQACNDNVCLAPATITSVIKLQIAKTNQPISRINKQIFDPYRQMEQ